MNELDEALADTSPEPVTAHSTVGPKRCKRHQWVAPMPELDGDYRSWHCIRCGVLRDPIRSRRGKQARNRGNAYEREVAKLLGVILGPLPCATCRALVTIVRRDVEQPCSDGGVFLGGRHLELLDSAPDHTHTIPDVGPFTPVDADGTRHECP